MKFILAFLAVFLALTLSDAAPSIPPKSDQSYELRIADGYFFENIATVVSQTT